MSNPTSGPRSASGFANVLSNAKARAAGAHNPAGQDQTFYSAFEPKDGETKLINVLAERKTHETARAFELDLLENTATMEIPYGEDTITFIKYMTEYNFIIKHNKSRRVISIEKVTSAVVNRSDNTGPLCTCKLAIEYKDVTDEL